MRTIILSITLCSVLSGCVGAVAVGAAGSSVLSDKRNIQTQMSDQQISHKISYWVMHNPDLHKTTHITVTTFNGIVLLSGQASTHDQKSTIIEHSEQVEGVKRIYDKIEIKAPTSLKRQAQDSWITAKTKAAMINQNGISSGGIKVVTEDSVVYLFGIVGNDEGNQATDIARQIPGVTKVVKLFEYAS
jgi:osmotically-inducible protein OsmY